MDNLEAATWGLVIATALLVVASAIPVAHAVIDRRGAKKLLAAQLVPGIHMLKSRLVRAQELMLQPDLKEEDVDYFSHYEAGDVIGQLHELMPHGPNVGMLFTNELAICLHLLTQAEMEVSQARRRGGDNAESEIRRRLEAVQRAGRLYRAARTTLDAAEAQLPEWSRKVDGKDFYDRFISVAEDREADAEKALVDERRRRYRP